MKKRIVYVIFVTHEMSDRKKQINQRQKHQQKEKRSTKHQPKTQFNANILYDDDLCSWNLLVRGATKKDGIK